MTPDTRSRKLGASGLHPDLAFASLSLRLFPARNRQQPAVASTINTANVITTPSMILVFFEVVFDPAVAEELELEDGRAEAVGRGRDGLGKRELKGLEMERGVSNVVSTLLCTGEKTLLILRSSYCERLQTE